MAILSIVVISYLIGVALVSFALIPSAPKPGDEWKQWRSTIGNGRLKTL